MWKRLFMTFPDGVFWPRFSGLTHQCHYGRKVAIQFGADWGNGPKREKPLTWRGKWRTEEGSNAKCCRGIWLLPITTKFIKVLVQALLNSELILGYALLRSVHCSRFWGFQRPCMNSLAWLGSRAGHWQSESFDWRIDLSSSFAVHLFAAYMFSAKIPKLEDANLAGTKHSEDSMDSYNQLQSVTDSCHSDVVIIFSFTCHCGIFRSYSQFIHVYSLFNADLMHSFCLDLPRQQECTLILTEGDSAKAPFRRSPRDLLVSCSLDMWKCPAMSSKSRRS